MTRKTRITRTRVAGQGGDGETYGVTTLQSSGGKHAARRSPCPTCPWRKDAEIGRFPPEAFRISAPTSYDAALSTFACHEAGATKPQTCAGFLLRHGVNNLAVRLSLTQDKIDLRRISSGGTELYETYREMAIANGVAPDDPCLKLVRGNMEEAPIPSRAIDPNFDRYKALLEDDD
jgi:hypothetical protein